MGNLLVKLFKIFLGRSRDSEESPSSQPHPDPGSNGDTSSPIISETDSTPLIPMIRRFRDNAHWYYDADGRILLSQGKEFKAEHGLHWIDFHRNKIGEPYARSSGEPISVRNLREDFLDAIETAAREFDLPVAWVAAMITIEARRRDWRWDPVSRRHEPGYISDEETPRKVSGGLMQTLLTTARSMRRRYHAVMETYDMPRDIDFDTLTNPLFSCLLGAAYMRYQIDRGHGVKMQDPEACMDLVLLCGSYNAGRLRETDRTPWGIVTYGRDRLIKMVAYHNDWIDEYGEGYVRTS